MAFADTPDLSFGATWNAVLGVLRTEANDAATTLHALGLTEKSVVAGELGRAMPMAPPFVYAFLIPSGSDGMRASDGVPHAPAAALRVYCGVRPEATTQAAVVAAMELGAAVLDALRRGLADAGVHARYEASPLRLDSYTSKLAVCEVAGTAYYSLAAGPPPVAYLVRDTFTDADGTLLDAHTPEVGGPWTFPLGSNEHLAVRDGLAGPVDGYNYGYALIDPGATDIVINVALSGHESVGYTALRFRWHEEAQGLGSYSGYCVEWSNTGAYIIYSYDPVNGRSDLIFTQNGLPPAYDLQIYVVGTTVRVVADGVTVIETADADKWMDQTTVGLGIEKNAAARIDDFTVRACSALP